jgi:hypothetical protein
MRKPVYREYVPMTKKELGAYLKEHPKATHFTYYSYYIIHCDICHKRINQGKYWLNARIGHNKFRKTETYEICSDKCAVELIKKFSEKFTTDIAPDDYIDGISFIKYNDPKDKKSSEDDDEDDSDD